MIYKVHATITKKDYLFNIIKKDNIYKANKVFSFGTKYFLENTHFNGNGLSIIEAIGNAIGQYNDFTFSKLAD